jgi:DNA-binding Xre family transcriptional regulator
MRATARIIFLSLRVLCYMGNLDEIICKYLYNEWIATAKSQRSFAIDHNIEEVTVRKIKSVALEGKKYSIPVDTLARICEARNLKLSDFFKMIE